MDGARPIKSYLLLIGILLALCAFVALDCLSLFSVQINDHMDSIQYLTTLVEFHENIKSGVWFPEWAPDIGNGNGHPLFTFLPPGLYWIAELFVHAGFAMTTALNATLILAVFLSALGMFLWCLPWIGAWSSLCAAVAYIYAPYFHTNLYVRGAYGEFMAFTSFPFLMWALDNILFSRDGVLSRVTLALAFASIFLFHNAMTLVFTPFVVIYVATLAVTKHTAIRAVVKSSLFLAIGAGIAAFYWLPGLLLKDQVSVGRLLKGYLNYQNHLIYLEQLFYSPWGHSILVPGVLDGMSQKVGELQLGAAIIIVIFLGVVSLGRSRSLRLHLEQHKHSAWACALLCGVLYSCFLSSNYSKFLWDRIELLQYLQFGMRFLVVATLAGSALIGLVAQRLLQPSQTQPLLTKTILPSVALIALTLLLNYSHASPPKKYNYDDSAHSPLSIAAGGFTANNKDEFKPKDIWVVPPFNAIGLTVVQGSAISSSIQRGPLCTSAKIQVQSDSALIRFARSCFPGWEVRIDDAPTQYDCYSPYGQIQVTVPSGVHALQACFVGGPLRSSAWNVSLVSLIGLLVLCLIVQKPRSAAS